MHVLHATASIDPSYGGPVTALTQLAIAQAQAGIQVTVAATFDSATSPQLIERLRDQGVKVHLVGPCYTPLLWHPQLAKVLYQAVAASDVVHIHSLWEEIQHRAARMSQRLTRPYLFHPNGMLAPWSLAQSRWRKRAYMAIRLRKNLDRAAAIHFTTETERDLTEPLHLRPPSIVEPLGIDLSEFQPLPSSGAFRRKHPQTEGRPMVVFLGRIHPGKGLEYLIPALAQAKPDTTVLVVVGPDSAGYQAQIELRIRQLGLQSRVIFTGLLSGIDKIAVLADADVFALPSDHENFGVAVVESLAAGTPVIISDQVQIHRDITAGEVGGVVPLDTAALARELTRWLNDRSLRESASYKAKAFARDRFDWHQIVARWRAHDESIVQKARAHE